MYGLFGYGGYGLGYGYGYGMDPTYIFVLIGAILSIAASTHVRTVFSKYSRVRSASGITGAMAAERILKSAGIYDVAIQHVGGSLSDHFDPRSNVIRLSDSTYNSSSVAAIGIAAHECGHVIQHKTGYSPIRIRSSLVPVANTGSRLGLPLVIIGIVMGVSPIITQIGILLFCFAVLFHLVTLPVEFDASARALRAIESQGLLGYDEQRYAGKVLKAAALTYVASAAASVMQLLRLILLGKSRGQRRGR